MGLVLKPNGFGSEVGFFCDRISVGLCVKKHGHASNLRVNTIEGFRLLKEV